MAALRALGLVALVALTAAALAGCGGDASASEPSPLDVGYTHSPDAGDIGDRVALGRYARAHDRVPAYAAPARADDVLVALLRGRLFLANLPYLDALAATRDGAPLETILGSRMAGPGRPDTVWVVRRTWADRNPEQLRELVGGLLAGYRFVYSPAGRAAWLRAVRTTLGSGPGPGAYDRYRSRGTWPRVEQPVTAAAHDRAEERWRAEGRLRGGLAFEEMWNPGPWQHAAERGLPLGSGE